MSAGNQEQFKFSEVQIKSICAAAPKSHSARRLNLLPQILYEWAFQDIRLYLSEEVLEDPQQIVRHTAVTHRAQLLLRAFGDLQGDDEHKLAITLLGWPQADSWPPTPPEIRNVKRKLATLKKQLAELAAAQIKKNGRGHPRNLKAFRIMLDVQAIYEYLSGKPAARQVHNRNHQDFGDEYGPFWGFAKAIWCAIYGSTDGLPAAIRNWERLIKEHGDKSPILSNIHMANPGWGVFAE